MLGPLRCGQAVTVWGCFKRLAIKKRSSQNTQFSRGFDRLVDSPIWGTRAGAERMRGTPRVYKPMLFSVWKPGGTGACRCARSSRRCARSA
jgi:hypothetical protein